MSKHKLEDRILQAAQHDVPDVLSKIKADERFNYQVKPKFNLWYKRPLHFVGAFVALLAIGLVFFNVFFVTQPVYSTIYVEINPSLEIDINEKFEIIEVRAINADGRSILAELTYTKGVELEAFLDALLSESLNQEYLSLDNPIVMYDVRAPTLNIESDTLIHLQSVFAMVMDRKAVYLEAVRGNLGGLTTEAIERAHNLGVGEQKWVIIEQIIRLHDDYTEDDIDTLVEKSITELRNIRRGPAVSIPNNGPPN